MEMNQLLKWYREQNKNMRTLAEFHAKYEAIHPFQDGKVTLRYQQNVA